ncbi:hypothetical protein SAMN04488093_106215 [Tropicibacter naphthalenivorans]|uniref:Uncharacterized protein n=1 Tax=Tropicibacter naphthalenivorans TaxID=441103 RepID=A0A0P1H1T1_9RHOB|nr:hypothetical protein TRN7648_03243 [Tropicibacter naphthalenivorans]SMC91253.1 hypothetical protein SAMN04488093_106215 [Tropicibacter naphthalenivorans]
MRISSKIRSVAVNREMKATSIPKRSRKADSTFCFFQRRFSGWLAMSVASSSPKLGESIKNPLPVETRVFATFYFLADLYR